MFIRPGARLTLFRLKLCSCFKLIELFHNYRSEVKLSILFLIDYWTFIAGNSFLYQSAVYPSCLQFIHPSGWSILHSYHSSPDPSKSEGLPDCGELAAWYQPSSRQTLQRYRHDNKSPISYRSAWSTGERWDPNRFQSKIISSENYFGL